MTQISKVVEIGTLYRPVPKKNLSYLFFTNEKSKRKSTKLNKKKNINTISLDEIEKDFKNLHKSNNLCLSKKKSEIIVSHSNFGDDFCTPKTRYESGESIPDIIVKDVNQLDDNIDNSNKSELDLLLNLKSNDKNNELGRGSLDKNKLNIEELNKKNNSVSPNFDNINKNNDL